jgi:ABC-type lipoprotein export system ATPase subunit
MRRDSQLQRVWSAAVAHTITEPVVVVVMGVSGSGKTGVRCGRQPRRSRSCVPGNQLRG